MKLKKSVSTGCGDWHLGWGYGGHDKLGKLSFDGEIFTWTGSSQGRHGQKYNKGAKLVFKEVNNAHEIIESKGSYPEWKEIWKSVAEIRISLRS